MDRTEEWGSILAIYDPNIMDKIDVTVKPSIFLELAHKVQDKFEACEKDVARVERLSKRKEFSNDPSKLIDELSSKLMNSIVTMKGMMDQLKNTSTSYNQRTSSHAMKHYDFIIQILSKKLSVLTTKFQSSVKVHQSQMKSRQARVSKYGTGEIMDLQEVRSTWNESESIRRRAHIPPAGSRNHENSNISDGNLENIHNGGGSNANNTTNSFRSNGNSTKSIVSPYVSYDDSKTKSNHGLIYHSNSNLRHLEASKIEQTISQMGELFVQMANLVMEQSETIQHIEDAVEEGLQETKEAHKSMMSFYEISKGNRSLIIKIFIIIIIFVIVFLYVL